MTHALQQLPVSPHCCTCTDLHTVACQPAGRWSLAAAGVSPAPHQQAAEDDGQGHRALAWQQPTADNRQRQQGVSKRAQLQEGALAPKNAGAMKDTLPRACFKRCRWAAAVAAHCCCAASALTYGQGMEPQHGPLGAWDAAPSQALILHGMGTGGGQQGCPAALGCKKLQCTAYC